MDFNSKIFKAYEKVFTPCLKGNNCLVLYSFNTNFTISGNGNNCMTGKLMNLFL